MLQAACTVTHRPGFSRPGSLNMQREEAGKPRSNQHHCKPGDTRRLSDTSHLNVDLLSEGSFLQFKGTPGICYFSICHELDIQHFLLALCLLQRENGGHSSRVCSWSKTLLWEAQHSPALTRMPASRSASATPMSASLRTAAV